MEHTKQNMFFYRITQAASFVVSKFIFKRKFLRNEIKGKKGPFVVIANHQSALDFVNLIGSTRQPMSFVISNSFYQTLPVSGIMDKIGVIPKQQFQTSLKDIKKMKQVIEDGKILVIYPAGLMCEDGLSTPIPVATYRFLQWMHADVYVAKTQGAYFVHPKWAKKKRPGRTYLDIYKLVSAEDIGNIPAEEFAAMCEKALLFDAYSEQEELRIRYKGGDNLEGLENVLYMCPHCGKEFSVKTEGNRIFCTECGFAQEADEYGFMKKTSEVGKEYRHVSDWNKEIMAACEKELAGNEDFEMSIDADIHMIDFGEKRFKPVGSGTVRLTPKHIYLEGTVKGERIEKVMATASFPSLPFKPGKYFELQDGEITYRCLPSDGSISQKVVNCTKHFYHAMQEHRAHQEATV